MKKTIMMMSALLLMLAVFCSCNGASKNNESTTNAQKKVLVLYFSWSNNTKKVADIVAARYNADVFRVERTADYPSDFEACANEAKAEQDNGVYPAFKGTLPNLDQYDVIFLGAPVWWGRVPQPFYTAIEKSGINWNGKTVVPFVSFNTQEYDSIKEILRVTAGATQLQSLGVKLDDTSGVNAWLDALDL